MKSAIGLLVAVLGGLLIYDGFAGRSLWGDTLAILRGKANGAGAGNNLANPNAAPNPNLAGGGDAQGVGQPTPTNPGIAAFPNPFPRGSTTTNPIGRIVTGPGRAV